MSNYFFHYFSLSTKEKHQITFEIEQLGNPNAGDIGILDSYDLSFSLVEEGISDPYFCPVADDNCMEEYVSKSTATVLTEQLFCKVYF